MIGWLVGWLVGYLVDWLVGWLVAYMYLVGWIVLLCLSGTLGGCCTLQDTARKWGLMLLEGCWEVCANVLDFKIGSTGYITVYGCIIMYTHTHIYIYIY